VVAPLAPHVDGSVVVEWFNVPSGADGDPGFAEARSLVFDQGVHRRDAHEVGIGDSGEARLPLDGAENSLVPVKTRDPERCAELSHPGDEYPHGTHDDVGALAHNGDLLDGTQADDVVAIGQSQSASRPASFVNAVRPIAGTDD
jgi:hypothetical protein